MWGLRERNSLSSLSPEPFSSCLMITEGCEYASKITSSAEKWKSNILKKTTWVLGDTLFELYMCVSRRAYHKLTSDKTFSDLKTWIKHHDVFQVPVIYVWDSLSEPICFDFFQPALKLFTLTNVCLIFIGSYKKLWWQF